MNIIVFGAAGQVGSRIVSEAVSRRHSVTAVVRRESQTTQFAQEVRTRLLDVRTGDIEDAVREHDFVISALRAPNGEEDAIVELTQAVVNAARSRSIPFLIVGGAAPLIVPDSGGDTVLTKPGFLPESVVPVARASQAQCDWCSSRLDPDGVVLCPPALLVPGQRTGTYRTAGGTLVVDEHGDSRISMEDFAVAALEEAEHRSHTGRLFTVGY
jgi:putative NADH-flavin reductase